MKRANDMNREERNKVLEILDFWKIAEFFNQENIPDIKY